MKVLKGLIFLVAILSSNSVLAVDFLATLTWGKITTNISGEPIDNVSYRAEYKKDGQWTALIETVNNTYEHVGSEKAGTVIAYRVFALHQGLESEPSNEAAYTVPNVKPKSTVLDPVKITITIPQNIGVQVTP